MKNDEQMKKHIIEIQAKSPKRYNSIISNDQEIKEWVMKNTQLSTGSIVEHIYSAVYNVSNICKYGNIKKWKGWGKGFSGCGPASKCKCTHENITTSMKEHRKTVSSDEQNNINNKRSVTMKTKYDGYEYNSQRPEIKKILSKSKLSPEKNEIISNKQWLYDQYVIKGKSASLIADEVGVDYSTILDRCRRHNFDIRRTNNKVSIPHYEINQYIMSLGFNILINDTKILNGLELDTVVIGKNLAIEINGLYSHSFHPSKGPRPVKEKHLRKSLLCEEHGILLFHITDWQWNNKKEIVKSMIANKLGLSKTKIYARKCKIQCVTSSNSRRFYDRTHLKGFKGAKYHYGLYHNDQLVLCMSFSIKKGQLHIERLSSELHTNVVGGANKLLKYAIKETNSKTVFSYCDRSHSNGNVYHQMGFDLIGRTELDYFWTDGSIIIPRQNAQHKNMKKWLLIYDHKITEQENMFNNNYRIYYGCGSLKFIRNFD